jgi:hypothetical protein
MTAKPCLRARPTGAVGEEDIAADISVMVWRAQMIPL